MWSHRIIERIKWGKKYEDLRLVPEHIYICALWDIIIININNYNNNTRGKLSRNKLERLSWRKLDPKTYWELSSLGGHMRDLGLD